MYLVLKKTTNVDFFYTLQCLYKKIRPKKN
jgi:hypothetical protein